MTDLLLLNGRFWGLFCSITGHLMLEIIALTREVWIVRQHCWWSAG